MINVFLDDIRHCPSGFVAARTAEECLQLLAECDVNILSLDFELGYGQPNGAAVVRGLIAGGRFPRQIFVHSSSPSGRALMVRLLREANLSDTIVHDGAMPESVLLEAATAAEKRMSDA